MCGGRKIHGNLGRLFDETLNEIPYNRVDESRWSAGARIEQVVKIRYARGEIDSATYHRLMDMAQNGQLRWDDLGRIENTSLPLPIQEQRAPRQRDVEIVSHLNKLYSHRKQLEQSRRETETVLQTLEKEAGRLQDQARTAGEKAQQTIASEEVARAYLQTRQEALERAWAAQERVDDLRRNLQRIESLIADLVSREAELKALESGEHLAGLEANIRLDLAGVE
jgi:hypothetical protein